MRPSNESKRSSLKAKQLALSSKHAASGEAKQRGKATAISCRIADAMPLHRCLYPTKKEQILAIYEWLEEEAILCYMLHTGQAITVSMVWSIAISYTATSSRQ